MKLLTVEDARARMLAEIEALAPETVPLVQSIGRVLAEEVRAVRDQPPFRASSMDGWAVRSDDTPGVITVVGESAAGRGFAKVTTFGQAVRIFTGAALPEGCDAVAIQEDVQREGDRIQAPQTAIGENVRQQGVDFRKGQILLAKGLRVDPWRLSLAAAAGRAELTVGGRPRVAVLTTGEEIVEAPAAPGRFQIYDSGSPGLAALIEAAGGVVRKARPVRDNLEDTIAALRDADADLIVTVGGASVGDHDLVREAAMALGLSLRVESIAVRPGKPTFFGVLADGRRILGLAGNPASALAGAELFLKPILAAYQGASPELKIIKAKLTGSLEANGTREHWMRARLIYEDGVVSARPYRDQDSSLVTVFAGADALLRRPVGAAAAEAGELVEVLPLSRA